MNLDELTQQPVSIPIGKKSYLFGELPIDALGRLQRYLKDTLPHPIEAVKAHLKGLERDDRDALLEGARRDALSWPPQVGTARGAAALLGTEAGQLATFHEMLKVHQPSTTLDDARALTRVLEREAGAWKKSHPDGEEFPKVNRLFRIAFGHGDDPELLEDDGPKALPVSAAGDGPTPSTTP